MDPLKNAAAGVVLLFMIIGAADLILFGSLVTILGIANGVVAGIVMGGIMLVIGLALAVMLWRSS